MAGQTQDLTLSLPETREGFISVLEAFQEKSDFYTILFYNSVTSTNDLAKELSRRDNPSNCHIAVHTPCTVIIADHQTGGRGRFDRTWFSPPGLNIYMSIIIRAEAAAGITDMSLINVVTSLSAINAIRQCTGLDVLPKWPNDIYISNRKIGGILSESVSMGQRVISCVTGIGVNVNMAFEHIPESLWHKATSLFMETGSTYNRAELLVAILEAFQTLHCRLADDPKGLINEWAMELCPLMRHN
ncbi:MAG: biotin--[acetyl-CoA-carboxylase] ligase [Nitrospirae bacterium]|nr:biotin--[acetyl-CoA-carboxylase] ligase [Nitrospirota bacterium]